MTGGCDGFQTADLLDNGGARVEPFGLTQLDEIGDLIVNQTALGADGGGEEAEVRRYAAVAAGDSCCNVPAQGSGDGVAVLPTVVG